MRPLLTFLTSLLLVGVLPAQTPCDDTRPPIVFVHGFLASGDTWTTQIQRFASNGHCQDRYFVFDWNTLSAAGADALLDQFIDSILLVTAADQVHLVGHSAGGGRGYSYLAEPDQAAKVISYAHIGSNAESGPAGPNGSTPTLNIWSMADGVVDGADIPGAENVSFTNFDHYQVATSAATFAALYDFFYGEPASTTSIEPETDITIGGRCLTLGENTPTEGALIEIFEANDQGAPTGDALGTFSIGADGYWGPVAVPANTRTLFAISSSAPGFRKVIYYYEPFVRDNPTVYLRTFPPPFSLAGILLSAIPNDDSRSVISIFTSTQAVIHGRDQLSLNGVDLATPGLADAEDSMIALFCYDDGNDGQGNGEAMGSFALFPFLQGADIPIDPEPDQTWTIHFNGSSLPVLNWKSQSEGVVIAVFNEPEGSTSLDPVTEPSPQLTFWPNPATEQVWIQLEGIPLDPDMVRLTDAQGRLVPAMLSRRDDGGIRLDTSALPVGWYTVSVQSPTLRKAGRFQVSR